MIIVIVRERSTTLSVFVYVLYMCWTSTASV